MMAKKTRKKTKVKKTKAKVVKKPVKKVVKRVVKKVVKKPVAKAAVAKKPKAVLRLKITKKILGHAPVEHEFVLTGGKRLQSVYDLIDELEHMHEDIFKAHVNELKHDFSTWVRDVFAEPDFAEDIQKIQNKIEMQRALMKKIVEEARKHAKAT